MKLKEIKSRVLKALNPSFAFQAELDNMRFLSGQTASRQVRGLENLTNLYDAEFRVSSQWGEDGIIDWLVHHLNKIPEIFIEFGVENYRESNTRFLLQHRNWRGLVIDGSQKNIDFICQDPISWRHDLKSTSTFVTRENINSIILQAGITGEIGILSIDIDGVDYWVWDAINCINPHIIIVEYNTVFGDLLPLTVPYSPEFIRSNAHHSNLYYGLSINAAKHLAAERGYTFVGSNRAGSNAFFIRDDRSDEILKRIEMVTALPSRFREGRNSDGHLNFTNPSNRTELIAALPVINVLTNTEYALRQAGELYSPYWKALLVGQLQKP